MELTPWFMNGEKPVRRGVHEILPLQMRQAFSFWDGKKWGLLCLSKEEAPFENRKKNQPTGLRVARSGEGTGMNRNPNHLTPRHETS